MKENKILEKIKSNKKLQYTIIFIAIVLVVIIFFINTFRSETKTENVDQIDAYVSSLEDRLSQTLSNVQGAGKVSVVITVESGMETVIAKKTTTTDNAGIITTEETPILVNGKTVVLKELYPKITGVLIVAGGADNISVLYKLQQATVSLLDVNLNQIQILTMK